MKTAEQARNEWDQLWLPLWPLASDELVAGVYRMKRGEAMTKRYVETNPQALSNLLVVDVDHADAALRSLSSIPMPNAVVENAKNGHAHAVWALSEPVTRTEYAHRKPLAYAAAVTEGLRRSLDGDKGYSGLITKNPVHETWSTYWVGDELRSLAELEVALGDYMPPRGWRRTKARKANPIGLGRNCALFETARTWAYREIRHHWGDPAGLGRAIHTHATELNADFSEPLPVSEVKALAASITRWIVTHSRMWADGPLVYEATFTAIQSARARKPRPGRAVTEKLHEANRNHGFQPRLDARDRLAEQGVI